MNRFVEIFIVVILLLLISPILLLFLVLVFIDIGSPVVFKQRRPGLNGEIFNIYKFRTMTNEYDKNDNLLSDKVRLTKFGNFLRSISADELLSLWCVLKGDMSLVGPRPLLVEYLPLYSKKQSRRHDVRPGVTGWAQVNGRNTVSWNEKFDLDVWYVDNRSAWLDLKILCLTVKKVIARDGISPKDMDIMPRFDKNEN